jgi:hypothetical protein
MRVENNRLSAVGTERPGASLCVTDPSEQQHTHFVLNKIVVLDSLRQIFEKGIGPLYALNITPNRWH